MQGIKRENWLLLGKLLLIPNDGRAQMSSPDLYIGCFCFKNILQVGSFMADYRSVITRPYRVRY